VDPGVSRDGAPSIEEGSPMECYVGLDVHTKASVFVIQDWGVRARASNPASV
jgi:hypothetical protein